MENQRFLSALIEEKLLTKEVAARLEKDAATLKKDAESLIYQRNLVNETEVAKVKSQVLGVPYKKIDIKAIDPELFKIIPSETAKTYKVFPISKTDNMLVVGMVNPDNVSAQQALRFIAKQGGFNLGITDWLSLTGSISKN